MGLLVIGLATLGYLYYSSQQQAKQVRSSQESAITDLRKQADALNIEKSTTEDLARYIDNSNKVIDGLKGDLSRMTQLFNDKKKEHDELTKVHGKLSNDHKVLEGKYAAIDSSFQDLRIATNKTVTQYNDLSGRYNKLADDNHTTAQKYNQLQDKNNEMSTKLNELASKSSELAKNANDAIARSNELTKTNADLRAQVATQKEQINSLNEKLKAAQTPAKP